MIQVGRKIFAPHTRSGDTVHIVDSYNFIGNLAHQFSESFVVFHRMNTDVKCDFNFCT